MQLFALALSANMGLWKGNQHLVSENCCKQTFAGVTTFLWRPKFMIVLGLFRFHVGMEQKCAGLKLFRFYRLGFILTPKGLKLRSGLTFCCSSIWMAWNLEWLFLMKEFFPNVSASWFAISCFLVSWLLYRLLPYCLICWIWDPPPLPLIRSCTYFVGVWCSIQNSSCPVSFFRWWSCVCTHNSFSVWWDFLLLAVYWTASLFFPFRLWSPFHS